MKSDAGRRLRSSRPEHQAGQRRGQRLGGVGRPEAAGQAEDEQRPAGARQHGHCRAGVPALPGLVAERVASRQVVEHRRHVRPPLPGGPGPSAWHHSRGQGGVQTVGMFCSGPCPSGRGPWLDGRAKAGQAADERARACSTRPIRVTRQECASRASIRTSGQPGRNAGASVTIRRTHDLSLDSALVGCGYSATSNRLRGGCPWVAAGSPTRSPWPCSAAWPSAPCTRTR